MFERPSRNDYSFLGERKLVIIHNASFISCYVRVGGICCAVNNNLFT